MRSTTIGVKVNSAALSPLWVSLTVMRFARSIRESLKFRLMELILMRCSKCGKCCERTEMLLLKEDIGRLESVGFSREILLLQVGMA